ncbi:MAG TPA: RES family NAD+ phosphorylase [Methylomirabilota bacterium]|nr:RES family NAD+ phosphorylase [Methylomirabilota bacterium]
MIRVWRITRARHAAFDGEGARRHGGRCTRPGIPVVYTSASLALAALEIFVNLERPQPPGDLVAIAADIPETLTISRLPPSELPANWRSYPAQEALAELGTRWARELKSAVLAVPSAVIPQELNYLLNPLHSRFKRIRVGAPEAFRFDARLRRG